MRIGTLRHIPQIRERIVDLKSLAQNHPKSHCRQKIQRLASLKIFDVLKIADIRVEIDDRNEKIGKKIRDTELEKVPYMLVLGEKEVNEGQVAVRRQGKGDVGTMPTADFVKLITEEIVNKTF